ncbi:hypothetical protein [Alicyclobacillus sp. SO9]|uniref:hypothetical protein n=1 Tax=Alicyclobacillus sp. SO9 TaxID=2665646 RepID=UPI0018E84F34|nr:hypothetical protein [Alicyclobacillus sp. SO9]QQE77843.1 hypothetical protein GI364_18265 [Alicyclobacillus sp. SO9]
MSQWEAVYVNDPDHDYDLILEIEFNGQDVGRIHKDKDGLELVWYANKQDCQIPLKWLKNLLQEAEDNLNDSSRV